MKERAMGEEKTRLQMNERAMGGENKAADQRNSSRRIKKKGAGGKKGQWEERERRKMTERAMGVGEREKKASTERERQERVLAQRPSGKEAPA